MTTNYILAIDGTLICGSEDISEDDRQMLEYTTTFAQAAARAANNNTTDYLQVNYWGTLVSSFTLFGQLIKGSDIDISRSFSVLSKNTITVSGILKEAASQIWINDDKGLIPLEEIFTSLETGLPKSDFKALVEKWWGNSFSKDNYLQLGIGCFSNSSGKPKVNIVLVSIDISGFKPVATIDFPEDYQSLFMTCKTTKESYTGKVLSMTFDPVKWQSNKNELISKIGNKLQDHMVLMRLSL